MRWMTFQAVGLADSAHRDISCNLNQQRRGFNMHWLAWRATSAGFRLQGLEFRVRPFLWRVASSCFCFAAWREGQ